MEKLNVVYEGQKRTRATHERSGTQIITDAPVDNQGKGESFSPSDLLCAATAGCMLTIMGIAAETHGFSIDGVRVDVTKEMNDSPRRVKRITCDIDLSGREYSPKEKRFIEAAASACPVMLSLHPEVEKVINYNY